MNNSKVFYTFVFGFTVAIFLCSFIKIGFDFAIFLLIFSILTFLFAGFLAGDKNKIILLSVFLFSFALGILRYDIKDLRNIDQDNLLNQFVGQKVILTGTVIDEPNVKEQSARLVVQTTGIKIDDKKSEEGIKVSGKILVIAGLFPEFRYGDRIRATGKLEKPENFISDIGNSFDYIGFLAKDDIFYELSFAQAQVISSGHGSSLKIKLFTLKNNFTDKIDSLIREPEASLLGGLLLGSKNSLGKEWQDNFRKAGVSHIVALSGYNITIVAEGIMIALSFLPRFAAMFGGALGILFFAIMTGGSATVLRASVMALLVLLAKATGRLYDVVRALFLAGLFMLIQNPKILVFDISFQLSFLSTIALIFVSPIIEKKFLFVPEKYKLREIVLATTSTQVFVLPFIFYKMGMISLVSLPANLLILPVIPIIMLLGFITGTLSFFSTILATPFAWISSLLLSYILKVIEIFANLSFSSLSLKNFPLIIVILIYLLYLIVIVRFQIVSRRLTSLN